MVNIDFDTALAHATDEWMGQDGVSAVGQGEVNGHPTIDVWVSGVATRTFPESYQGYPVVVHKMGDEIYAQGGASA